MAHGLLLGLLVDLLELALQHGAPLAKIIVKLLFKDLISVHHCFLALIFADVAPTGLDGGDGSGINGVDVGFGQIVEHFSIKWFVVQLLRFDAIHDLSAKRVHLLNEFGPQVVQRDIGQVLQLVFLGQWPNHSAAIALLEETFQKAPDSIFLIDSLAETFLVLQGFFKVVLGCDWLRVCVDEL